MDFVSSSILTMTFMNIRNHSKPYAYASVIGNNQSELHGMAYFYNVHFNDSFGNELNGILVEVEVFDLPSSSPNDANHFYGMHIHEVGNCTPPFDKTGNHYNPENTIHPNHAGDLPPLLGNNGYAYSLFFTSRLAPEEILGKSLIIHNMPDDFTSQPSGNSGEKIGCGVIRSYDDILQPR